MNITLGPYQYRMRRTDQRLFVNRKPVLAICDHQARELVIQDGLNHQTLRQVIADAVGRIWAYRFGEQSAAAITAGVDVASDEATRPDGPDGAGGARRFGFEW